MPPDTSIPAEDSFARELRGWGPIGIVATLVILIAPNDFIIPIGAILALLWARRSHTPLAELGFVQPGSWILTAVGGIAFGIAFKFLMKAIVMPLIGAAPVNQAYHYLAGNRAALPGAIYTMIVAAGFGEEVVFRGFLYQRLRTLFGHGPAASAIIITITAAVFGLAHYFDQGLPGVEQAVITGIVFGTTFVIAGQIWIVMFAHAAFDLTAVAMIYLNVESRIGHSVFG